MTKWVQRFNRPERLLHQVVMLLFLILLLTGLFLHFDLLREWIGAGRYYVRIAHEYTGLVLIIVPWVLIWVWRRELTAFFSEMTRWRAIEVDWLHRETRMAFKFNGGQKLNFLLAMIWMLGLAFTGFFIWQSQWISSGTREFLYAWHIFLFYLLTIQIGGHVFFALIYKPTRHAMRGILQGQVKRSWAKKHHPLWIDELDRTED